MWNRAKELEIPLFAGSSLVVCYRRTKSSISRSATCNLFVVSHFGVTFVVSLHLFNRPTLSSELHTCARMFRSSVSRAQQRSEHSRCSHHLWWWARWLPHSRGPSVHGRTARRGRGWSCCCDCSQGRRNVVCALTVFFAYCPLSLFGQ